MKQSLIPFRNTGTETQYVRFNGVNSVIEPGQRVMVPVGHAWVIGKRGYTLEPIPEIETKPATKTKTKRKASS